MKEIHLKRGLVAIIDDEDFELVSRYKWRPCPDRSFPPKYRAIAAAKVDGRYTSVFMHRLVLGITDDRRVDHKNRDSLDNRRENLRIATPMENTWNMSPHARSQVKFKGVCVHPGPGLKKKYIARIRFQKKSIHLGFYRDPVDAAKAYDAKALELFGEFACVNFPELAAAAVN